MNAVMRIAGEIFDLAAIIYPISFCLLSATANQRRHESALTCTQAYAPLHPNPEQFHGQPLEAIDGRERDEHVFDGRPFRLNTLQEKDKASTVSANYGLCHASRTIKVEAFDPSASSLSSPLPISASFPRQRRERESEEEILTN